MAIFMARSTRLLEKYLEFFNGTKTIGIGEKSSIRMQSLKIWVFTPPPYPLKDDKGKLCLVFRLLLTDTKQDRGETCLLCGLRCRSDAVRVATKSSELFLLVLA